MNPRERILAIVTGVFLSCFVGYILVRQLLLGPAVQLDAETRKLTQDVNKLEAENRQEGYYKEKRRELFSRSYGNKEREVGNALAKRLEFLLNRSGFDNTNQSLTPVTGSARPGVYREIGRSVSVKGTLKDVTNFLYLLKSEPSLRRLDNLVLIPKQGGQVDLRFKYSTLVLTQRKIVPTPTTAPTDTPGADLDSKERRQYDVIAIRDLFRPYIKRPPAPPAARPIPRAAWASDPPPGAGGARTVQGGRAAPGLTGTEDLRPGHADESGARSQAGRVAGQGQGRHGRSPPPALARQAVPDVTAPRDRADRAGLLGHRARPDALQQTPPQARGTARGAEDGQGPRRTAGKARRAEGRIDMTARAAHSAGANRRLSSTCAPPPPWGEGRTRCIYKVGRPDSPGETTSARFADTKATQTSRAV